MTTDEYIVKLRAKMNAIKANNKPLALAVASVHAEQMERIFVKGGAESGKIGSYSTKPMLASKGQFIDTGKFKITKWTKFKKAKKAIPVMEIGGGYKAFRALNGRESSFVNLRWTGDLQRDLSNSLQKISPHTYVSGTKRKINSDKSEWMEDKYGSIFNLSKKEKTKFNKIALQELYNSLK